MSDYKDQIWAFIHGELSAEREECFKQAFRSDPDLRKEVEECRDTHMLLKESLNQPTP